MRDFYEENNPLVRADEYTVAVNIINALPLSQNTWQITWEETRRSADGMEINKSRWLANITYAFSEPNAKYLNDNPFGLYITKITWSKNQSTE